MITMVLHSYNNKITFIYFLQYYLQNVPTSTPNLIFVDKLFTAKQFLALEMLREQTGAKNLSTHLSTRSSNCLRRSKQHSCTSPEPCLVSAADIGGQAITFLHAPITAKVTAQRVSLSLPQLNKMHEVPNFAPILNVTLYDFFVQ